MELEKTIQIYLSLDLDSVIDHQKFSEYSISHHSTAIEGSTLTENDTRLLLDEGTTPKGKPLEHSLMVKDHHEALQFVLRNAREKNPITVELIQKIAAHAIDAGKGEFRKGNVSAGGSYFPNYDKVEGLTKILVDRIRKAMSKTMITMDATELAFTAHFDFVSIHPFYDGNGRTSRLLMNYIQAYHKLPLAKVYKEDRADYFQALSDTRKKEDIGIFQDFMKSQYEKMLKEEIKAYKLIQKNPRKSNPDKGRGKSLFF